MENKQIKTILKSLAAVIFLSFILSISLSFKHPVGIAVRVDTLPQDAKITANGKKISNGTAHLKPGSYDVIVSNKGFKTIQSTVVISEIRDYIQVELPPISADAKAWAAKHDDLYVKFEGIAGKNASKSGEAFLAKNPITKLLPADKITYKVGYIQGADESITLTIYANDANYRAEALQLIRDWGYDPTDYRVIFNGFTNPLGQL